MRDNSIAQGDIYSSGNRKKRHGSVLSGEQTGYGISKS